MDLASERRLCRRRIYVIARRRYGNGNNFRRKLRAGQRDSENTRRFTCGHAVNDARRGIKWKHFSGFGSLQEPCNERHSRRDKGRQLCQLISHSWSYRPSRSPPAPHHTEIRTTMPPSLSALSCYFVAHAGN